MLFWVSSLVGLVVVSITLAAAVVKADRRARLHLYRAPGLTDETVDLLMAQSGDLLAGLARARVSPRASPEPEGDTTDPTSETTVILQQPVIRVVRWANSEVRRTTPAAASDERYGVFRKLD
jgi:hypothetical protein